MSYNPQNQDTVLKIDLDVIAQNYQELNRLAGPNRKVVGVIKADAYGHGLLPVAKTLLNEGCPWLAVASIDEALLLRTHGISSSIMVLMGFHPLRACQIITNKLTPLINDWLQLEALSQEAQKANQDVYCHLKVDTGMGRLGVSPNEVLNILYSAKQLPNLHITGMISHFATAGIQNNQYASIQSKIFADLLANARAQGFDLIDSSHANSGGFLVPPEKSKSNERLVRPGLALYGAVPETDCVGKLNLSLAMNFSTRLIQIKKIPKGHCVSYGCTWRALRETVLGVIPVGYSDGYPRKISNRGYALVGGQKCFILGRVCMNMVMLDLTNLVSKPQIGDEAVLMGRQENEFIDVDQLANWSDTISYEMFCNLGSSNEIYYIPR